MVNWIREATKPTYTYKKFRGEFDGLVPLLKMTQKQMKRHLGKFLKKYYSKVVSGDGYLYAIGTLPIILTAHMDTVHKQIVSEVEYRTDGEDVIIHSPQGIGGDDRCGIWLIKKLVEVGHRPTIIFCEDEEIGCVGAGKLIKTKSFCDVFKGNRYIVELDRRGKNDAVYYDLDNEEFEEYITKWTGRETNWGSCSDISYLAPELGIAAVNFSVGYYNEHKIEEEINLNQLQDTLGMMGILLSHEKNEGCEPFEYREIQYVSSFDRSWNCYGFSHKRANKDDDYRLFEFVYIQDGQECVDEQYASSIEEAVGMFMMDNPKVCWNEVIDYIDYGDLYGKEVM